MKFIPHIFKKGADVDAESMQNLVNNDQFLYDEVIRRPRGVIAYADLGRLNPAYKTTERPTVDTRHQALDETPNDPATSWKTIRANKNYIGSTAIHTLQESLSVDADIESNRLIMVEVYIPLLQVRAGAAGNSPFKGIRITRNGSQLSAPTDGWSWDSDVKRDRRTAYTKVFDAPLSGRYTYSAQWRLDPVPPESVTVGSGGLLTIRTSQAHNKTDLTDMSLVIPPAQIIVTDMGDASGYQAPDGAPDIRSYDKSIDTSQPAGNIRRSPGTAGGNVYGF